MPKTPFEITGFRDEIRFLIRDSSQCRNLSEYIERFKHLYMKTGHPVKKQYYRGSLDAFIAVEKLIDRIKNDKNKKSGAGV